MMDSRYYGAIEVWWSLTPEIFNMENCAHGDFCSGCQGLKHEKNPKNSVEIKFPSDYGGVLFWTYLSFTIFKIVSIGKVMFTWCQRRRLSVIK